MAIPANATKLTVDEIKKLQPGSETFFVRLLRLWQPAPQLIWEGESQLHIQRAPAFKNRPERLAVISPRAYDWAEGGEESVDEAYEKDGGVVLVEDYQMEIYRLS